MKFVPSSFDVIGSKEKKVAIVEIPDEMDSEKKRIAEEIMSTNKNVKSVLRKISERRGEHRTREFELLAGSPDTEVVHKENNYILKLDPQKVYFSPREGTERQRIAEQVKAGETVLVMFSGVCAYAIAIAKKQPNVEKIFAVEINHDAAEYAKENVRINKISHLISLREGDVRKICPEFFGKCDRVIMPLPLGAKEFLDIAVRCLKKKGIIHFYSVADEGKFSGVEKDLEIIKQLNRTYEIKNIRRGLPYAPRKFKIRVDIEVK